MWSGGWWLGRGSVARGSAATGRAGAGCQRRRRAGAEPAAAVLHTAGSTIPYLLVPAPPPQPRRHSPVPVTSAGVLLGDVARAVGPCALLHVFPGRAVRPPPGAPAGRAAART